MSRKSQSYPEVSTPHGIRYHIGVGHYYELWFVGIRPPISHELLTAAGGKAIKGWAVEDLDLSGSTVLRKFTDATYELASQTAIALTAGIAREAHASVVYSPVAVEMAFNTAPFEHLQTKI